MIVIDNLDRVEVEDAVAMWTTLRVFFDFPEDTKWNRLTWLIVPFDRAALSRLRGGDEDDISAFLSKTFQVTFHVSPPVLFKRKGYFMEQMATVFPSEPNTSVEMVYQVYELLRKATPWPRDIKIL